MSIIVSAEAVEEVKNEEVAEVDNNEVIEETNEETQIKENEETTKQEVKTEVKEEAKPKPKATPKKLARTGKVVELVECQACNKKMTPESLKHTHPHYCKGQPTETLPVNKQKASYGSKVEQKLRKEIEEEMKKKYETKPKETEQIIQYSEPIEVKTQAEPVRMEEPRQLTARELFEASYNEIRKAKREVLTTNNIFHLNIINNISVFKSKPEFKRMPQVQQYYDVEDTFGVASRRKEMEDEN